MDRIERELRRIAYLVRWSSDEQAFIATCRQYPQLSHAADHPRRAVVGLEQQVRQLLEVSPEWD
jgi:hypothetical protein